MKRKRKTCRGPKCKRLVTAKGLCHTHYAQMARGAALTPIRTYTRYMNVEVPPVRVKKADYDALAAHVDPAALGKAMLEAWIAAGPRTGDGTAARSFQAPAPAGATISRVRKVG